MPSCLLSAQYESSASLWRTLHRVYVSLILSKDGMFIRRNNDCALHLLRFLVPTRRVGMQFVTRRVTKGEHLSVGSTLAEAPQRGKPGIPTQRVGMRVSFLLSTPRCYVTLRKLEPEAVSRARALW